jgi:N-acetylglucosaminyl-diphospho-decaprenol L-rhamnosyltransferase
VERDQLEPLRADIQFTVEGRGASPRPGTFGISVVVPTFNSADHIAACLTSVRQRLPDAEVIVVDNGSADETCELVGAALPTGLLVTGHGNVGFGRACNLGAAHASRGYILFLNPDAELISVDTLKLEAAARSSPFGMLAAMLREDDASLRPTLRRHTGVWLGEFVAVHLLAMLSPYAPRPRYVESADREGVYTVSGAAFLVSREEFCSVGGFDERFFMYYEDTDLTQRYRRMGYPLRSSSALIASHVGGASAPAPQRNALSFLGWLEYIDKWHGSAAAARGATVARLVYYRLLTGLRIVARITGSERFHAKAEQLAAMLSHIAKQGLDAGAADAAGRYPAAGPMATRKFAASAPGTPAMSTQAISAAPDRRTRAAVAGVLGLAIHRMAKAFRRIVPTGTRVPDNLAVVCDSFLFTASQQAVALQATGLKVTLYYVDRRSDFTSSEEDRTSMLEHARAHGVELVPVPRLAIAGILPHALRLHRDLRRRKISTLVVHAHGDPRYASLGLWWPVALVIHDPQIHSGDVVSTAPLPIRLISRAAELTAACLVIHSARLLDQIRPLLRRVPIGVIPLALELAPGPVAVPDERSLLVFGRLFAYKGVDTALEAFRLLPAELSDVKLVVAGQGPLAELARGQPNVEVREEYVPDKDMAVLIEQARLVLLPYKDATQSGVGLQAVSRGVPCVVTRTGGLPELMPDSLESLVVAPNDPSGFADAIVEHIDHGEELRRAIYDHAASHLATPVAAQRLRAELRRLGLEQGASTDGGAA